MLRNDNINYIIYHKIMRTNIFGLSYVTIFSVSFGKLSSCWFVLGALFFQAVLLFTSFSSLCFETGNQFFNIDHPFHYYQVSQGRELARTGNLIGYDPFFGGGHIGGVTFNASAKLPVLLSFIVPDYLSTSILYAGYVVVCALIAPVAITGMGIVLGWSNTHLLVATLLGFFFWWISSFHWYHTAGMVSFVCSSYVSMAYATWVYKRVLTRDAGCQPFRSIGAGVVGGFGLWLHPLFGVLAAILLLGFIIAYRTEIQWRRLVFQSLLISIVAVLINLPWLFAMRSVSTILEQPYQKLVGIELLVNAVLGRWHIAMGSILNPIVVSVSFVGLMVYSDTHKRKEANIFLGVGIALLILAAFGAISPNVALLQPNRLFAPGFLAIGVAGSYAVIEIIWRLRIATLQSIRLLVVIVTALCMLYLVREVVNEVSPGNHPHYGRPPPETTTIPESVVWLATWLKEHTTSDGRILFETSLARVHGGGHAAGYLALVTGREFIGAAYPFLMPEISFWDKWGFGVPLDQLDGKRLSSGLVLYNVGWVVSHTKELSVAIEALPYARRVAEYAGIRIFALDRNLSYFASGDGYIESRGIDKIEVVASTKSDVVMRYQWVPGIATTPPSKIEPIILAEDFPPFIKISNAPNKFTIHLTR